MKFEKLPRAKIISTDRPSMQKAIKFLLKNQIDVRRPSAYQLKLDETTSYYPSKGTLFIDGEDQAWAERGQAALDIWLGGARLKFAEPDIIELHKGSPWHSAKFAHPSVNPSCATALPRPAQEEMHDPCR